MYFVAKEMKKKKFNSRSLEPHVTPPANRYEGDFESDNQSLYPLCEKIRSYMKINDFVQNWSVFFLF